MNIKEKKFISFDMWNTLISPNPEFKESRVGALSGYLDIEPHQILNSISLSKGDLNFLQESHGIAFSSLVCWEFLLNKISLPVSYAPKCLEISNWMFTIYPPKINADLLVELEKLSVCVDIGIISNTNFVPGDVLFKTVFSGYRDIFKETVFSDETLVAKPSGGMFALGWPYLSANKILHIGDNKVTDGAAEKFGAEFLHVKNPEDTLDKVKQFLHTLNN